MSRDNPLDSGAIYRPTPTEAYLSNPHKGCCTFQGFNGDPLFPGMGWSEEGPVVFPSPVYTTQDWPQKAEGLNYGTAPGYLPSTVAYCRWFWNVLEPEEGRYDFSIIEAALSTAESRGQTMAIRLMPFGSVSSGQPRLPKWYSDKYPLQPLGELENVAPLYNSADYLKVWGQLIKEFSLRYDDDERLETLDVAYIGPWGEGAGECCQEQCERFAKLYRNAFKKTPRLSLVANNLRVGLAQGSGWRADCFGDLHRPWNHNEVIRTREWNHMYNCYPRLICEAEGQDAWKTAPVHFETCWSPAFWHKHGSDLDFILQQGLKYHATYFMPKSISLPDAWLDKLAQFCKNLGYRFVFRQAIIDRRVAQNGTFSFEAWIENIGVAPIYRHYNFALRLRQGTHEYIHVFNEIDIRKWLPGDVWIQKQIQLPAIFQNGWVEISAGLIHPKTQKACVSFASDECFGDRWLLLNGIEIRDK